MRRSPGRLVAVVAAVSGLLLAAGCGTDEGDPAADEPGDGEATVSAALDAEALSGRTFTSTKVTGRELASADPIVISFDDGQMSVSAGCNTMFGSFAVEGDTLEWAQQPASTLMACDKELEEQDAWLADLLTAGVTAEADGATLTLASDDVTIELTDGSTQDLDSLLGRTWTVIGTIRDGRTIRLPVRMTPPRLGVRGNGTARLDTGCNTGRTVVRVVDDGLEFGPTTTTRVACRQPAREIERRVLAVLDGRSDYVSFDGTVLVVVRGDTGLMFEVR